MGYIREEVIAAAARAQVAASLRELSPQESAHIRAQLRMKFAKGGVSSVLWEDLGESVAVQHAASWRWVDDFVKGMPTILLFDEREERTMFAFQDGSLLVPTLEEAYAFEFYLTDPATEYLLCFNHHDFLIASGAARRWLEERRRATALR